MPGLGGAWVRLVGGGGGVSYTIRYNRSRFPERQRREDGSWGCRGCGSPIPKGRQAWCSDLCVQKFHPLYVIDAVKKRDKGICNACGFDTSEWWKIDHRRAEYDHIIPFSEGGLTVLENMRTLCAPCHRERTKAWHGERAAARRPQRSLLASPESAEREGIAERGAA